MMNLVLREIVARASVEAKQNTDCPLACSRDDFVILNKGLSQANSQGSDSITEGMASGSGVNGFYRPRSALARALYEKQHNDRYLQELDQNECAKRTRYENQSDPAPKQEQNYPDSNKQHSDPAPNHKQSIPAPDHFKVDAIATYTGRSSKKIRDPEAVLLSKCEKRARYEDQSDPVPTQEQNYPDSNKQNIDPALNQKQSIPAPEHHKLDVIAIYSGSLLQKHHNPKDLLYKWYFVRGAMLTPELKVKFVHLHPDEETKVFLSSSIEKSSWVWTQCWYLMAKAVLKHFWSITDINGWLGRGSMFVLSEAQARALLRPAGRLNNKGALVDVGAGDGEVSRRFAHLYANIYATEISASMRKVLIGKGYTILDTENWWNQGDFDCVCMLNLLDRCAKPKTMLEQAKKALAPGGVLLLALVLPYKPYVEVTPDHKPLERLPIEGKLFEDQVLSFVKFMKEEAGYELVSWSRAPYLCEGDFAQAYYWLDDSVYVFKPKA